MKVVVQVGGSWLMVNVLRLRWLMMKMADRMTNRVVESGRALQVMNGRQCGRIERNDRIVFAGSIQGRGQQKRRPQQLTGRQMRFQRISVAGSCGRNLMFSRSQRIVTDASVRMRRQKLHGSLDGRLLSIAVVD